MESNTPPLRIRMGIASSYLLPAREGYVLIDTGSRGHEEQFFRALARHHILPHAIKLIILTHVHFDHVGCARAIQVGCGAPVMVHHTEAALLASGAVVIPAGTYPHTKVCGAVARQLRWGLRFLPVSPDYVVDDGLSLTDFGLEAQIIHTPGHSPGSLTVRLANGAAYVGDLCYNALPLGLGPITPVYADDLAGVYASWQRLLEMGITRIYPAHSQPFAADRLRHTLMRRNQILACRR
jgi:hydroxyacylglutathione hydrolase